MRYLALGLAIVLMIAVAGISVYAAEKEKAKASPEAPEGWVLVEESAYGLPGDEYRHRHCRC